MRAGRLALHREHAKPAQFLVEHRKCLGEALVHSQLVGNRLHTAVESALRADRVRAAAAVDWCDEADVRHAVAELDHAVVHRQQRPRPVGLDAQPSVRRGFDVRDPPEVRAAEGMRGRIAGGVTQVMGPVGSRLRAPGTARGRGRREHEDDRCGSHVTSRGTPAGRAPARETASGRPDEGHRRPERARARGRWSAAGCPSRCRESRRRSSPRAA
jgi:hypothetical protein